MFVPDLPIAKLHPAPYNPREITPDALETLIASIGAIGFAKPIIANESGTIIAGHQRTKAASAMGMTTVPGFVVKNASTHDEVLFNQLHNGTDVDEHATPVDVGQSETLGFEMIEPGQIRCADKMPGVVFRNEICRLTMKYGGWGSAIATQSGQVIASKQVAASYKLIRQPLRVYRIPDRLAVDAASFTSRPYGVYSYKHIPRNSWIQTLAQPFRLRNETNRKMSNLYETMLLREIDGKRRILDFGCGQGDYVAQLSRIGFNITGMEFFYRPEAKAIDTAAVHLMVDKLCERLRRFGLFDVTICDSVLNSVNTLEAESDVMTCINAFTKPGGAVYLSTRQVKKIDSIERADVNPERDRHRNYLYFLDEDGFTAKLRDGSWFFQKYHSREQITSLVEKFIGPIETIRGEAYWLVKARKTVNLPDDQVQASIEREFNLDWPDGMRVNRHEEALTAWRAARTPLAP
jgi:ParB family chromosome partitioning protein